MRPQGLQDGPLALMDLNAAGRMADPQVAQDTRTVADFIRIYCDGHHKTEARAAAETDAALLGVYGGKRPVLCAGCLAHLAYAEKRRAYCPRDPKPFCAHCDSQCYSSDELEWQRGMMRYSGPRSWYQGHAIAGIRHALEARTYRRRTQRGAESAAPNSEER